MKTRFSRLLPSIALTALLGVGCQLPGSSTPTPLPSPTTPPTAAPTRTPASPAEAVNQGVDTVVTDFMTTHPAASGCSVVVVQADASGALAPEYHHYGTLARDTDVKVDDQTEYEIGSLTKLFTAGMLAVQVGKGQMDLGDPAQKFMPDAILIPTLGDRAITIGQLAEHTSGLPRRAQGLGGSRKVNGVLQQGYASQDDLAQFLSTYNLTSGPGDQWQYSNLGYGVLGVALEKSTGEPYDQAAQDLLISPLGLQHTRVVLTKDEIPHLAQGYNSTSVKGAPFTTEGVLLAAGGLRSTPADLAAFLIANLAPGKTHLGAALGLTQQPLANGPDPAISQGLGWEISNAGRPDEVFFKGGLTSGFSSYIAFSAVDQNGFAVMCNAPGVATIAGPLNQVFKHAAAPEDKFEIAP